MTKYMCAYIHMHSTEYVRMYIYIFGYGCMCNWKGATPPSPEHRVRLPLSSSTAFLIAQLLKNPPAMQEILAGFPESARSPGKGIGYSLQYSWASLVTQLVKNPPAMWEAWVWSLGWEDPLEEGKASHCSILAWRIQSMGSQRVGHDWLSLSLSRRKDWKATPLFLPGEPHGQRTLAGYNPWGCKGSDTTEWLSLFFNNRYQHIHCYGEMEKNRISFMCTFYLLKHHWGGAFLFLPFGHLHFNLSQKTIYKRYVFGFFLWLCCHGPKSLFNKKNINLIPLLQWYIANTCPSFPLFNKLFMVRFLLSV